MIYPGRAMQPDTHGCRHRRVVAWVEFNLVDAPAAAVVAVQLGRMHMGQPRMRLDHGRAQPRCVGLQRIPQGLAGFKQVVVDPQRGLLENFRSDVHGRPLSSGI